MCNNRKEEIAFNKGYRVNTEGTQITYNGNKLKLQTNMYGYKYFRVRTPLKSYALMVTVHRFQAFCKYGSQLYNSDVVRHLDSDKNNNSISNVAVGTFLDNYLDRPNLELDHKIMTERAVKKIRRLNDKEVIKAFKLRKEGLSYKAIGDYFGLAKATIYYILNINEYSTKLNHS